MPYHRFSDDQRHVQRSVFPHQIQHAIDQSVAAKIADLPQGRGSDPEMVLPIGVTAGTVERTLAGDLNREQWGSAIEDIPPTCQEFSRAHAPAMLRPGTHTSPS